jgi:branched-chain amino acid transport system substrate-binding protein
MRLAVLATVLIASLATSCTTTSPPSRDQGPVIAIASDPPTSGVDNLDVVPLRAAIELAIHDQGSVHGYPLVYEPFDDALVGIWSPFKGEQNVRIMIKQPQILAVVGPYNSQVAQFEIPVTNEAGLVMISPSNTVDCLTSLAAPCARRPTSINNYFRIAASNSAQASAAALFAVGKLKLKRFAVLTDGSDYGTLLADTFSAELKASGGAVVSRQTYSQNTNDYSSLLRNAHDAGAEAVFVGGEVGNGACRVRGGMSGVFPTDAYMLAGDNITDTTCAADAGKGANDHLLAMISSSQPAPTSKVFKEFTAHGIRPTTYTFGAYDCAQVIIDAISRAIQINGGKLPNRGQVLDAVAATHALVGTTGTFTFQPNGDAINPAVSVYRLQNGDWSFWQSAT